ncbi:MAG: hypothetical protein A2147_06360 [Chloroflexi bacterium RBG_16_57_8]|nr:MAG: hypothetical protein A2147_06360 [Chloroflexi bacterium RBG_16_57_8]
MKWRPIFGFRGLKCLLKKDRFAAYKYKWEDPSGSSPSPDVLKRTIDIGAISIGIRYVGRGE